MTEQRLQRALARAGAGSRRACEALIAAGKVKVNGRTATLGDKVKTSRDVVTIDGRRVPLDPELAHFAFNKPAGVVSTLADPRHRPDIARFMPAGVEGLFAVGRLDADSEGLLLLTNDGELAHRLMHPRHGVEKEYLAEVNGTPSARRIVKLRRGVELSDGPARALEASVAWRTAGKAAVRVVMAEGRKRELRRMLSAIGHPVVRLVRVRVGPVRLGRLAPGAVRELTTHEVRSLYEAAGL